ncbi:hypothetical protein T4D_6039 [Trichinella pseudospiralis]|uniref:Uncharacterized protein n=1 Tax=Trichinella pseudospiralis TaxID=6337 RepID=A0A0V1DKF2_TRIPS|nr:hypothetical protein T4D_6039 [Trichinella pseudospiralis]
MLNFTILLCVKARNFFDLTVNIHRGRHEADRGRHEAELWNEDIRYMRFPKGPNSVSLG